MKLNWFRLYLLLCMCILTYTAKAQFAPLPANSTAPMPWFHQQFVGADGAPLVGGLVYTYVSNSSVQHPSYRDSVGTLNQNPIQLDSGGYADIWLDNTSYRICVYDSSNVLQFCKDNITAAPAVLGLTYAQLSGGNVFLGGAQVIASQGAATSGANLDSHSLRLRASFWNGTAAADDDWLFVNKMGTGSNPSSTLTFSHTGSSGTAGVSFGTTPLLSPVMTTPTTTNASETTPKILTSFDPNSTAIQMQTAAGCTTGTSQFATCDVPVTWPHAFADTNYRVVCSGDYPAGAGVPLVQGLVTASKTTTGVTVRIAKMDSAVAVSSFGFIECLATH